MKNNTRQILLRVSQYFFNAISFNNLATPWIKGIIVMLILYVPIKLCIKNCPFLIGK